MNVWTIYYNPEDAPGLYVVRRFRIANGKALATADRSVHPSLDSARAAIPEWCEPIDRDGSDVPCVVECWL